MRVLVEASSGEYDAKREPLIRALVDELQPIDPDFAEAMEKALSPENPPTLKHRVLRDLKAKTDAAYRKTLDAMVAAIDVVLDRSVQKSEPTHDEVRKSLQEQVGDQRHLAKNLTAMDTYAGYQDLIQKIAAQDRFRMPLQPPVRLTASEVARVAIALAKAEAEEAGGEPPDPDFDEETGEPIIDPQTGLSPSEQAASEGDGTAEEEEEPEEKSLSPKMRRRPVKKRGPGAPGSPAELRKAEREAKTRGKSPREHRRPVPRSQG